MPEHGTTDYLREEFDARFSDTLSSLETGITGITAVGGVICTVVTGVALVSGAVIPPLVVAVAAVYSTWAVVSWVLLRRRRYPSWMRYASTLIDVSLGSVLMWFDFRERGLTLALTAAGPPLYAYAVTLSMLKLNPRLSVLAGIAAGAQLLGMTLLLAPAAPAYLIASGALFPHVTAVKVLMLVSIGLLGFIGSRAMRRMLWQLTATAVERERVRSLFGMHVSSQVVDHLLSANHRAAERRTVTVAFIDIRDFTTLSERLDPEQVLRLLNGYFDRMCTVVAEHGGLVNKFLGDGMLVIFGAPADQPDDAERALKMARSLVDEASALSKSGRFPGLRIGIGLHRGEAVVGSVGGSQRLEYTAIGDVVNTASRVQDLTKLLGHSIVATRACADAAGFTGWVSLGSHSVKGRQQQVELFGLDATVAATSGAG